MSLKIPKLVALLSVNFEAWIVGSAADPNNKEPRDWDVIVEFSQWEKAASLIPLDAKPNSFRGWKCFEEGVEIDVWPGEIGFVMRSSKSKYAWHYLTDTRWVKMDKI